MHLGTERYEASVKIRVLQGSERCLAADYGSVLAVESHPVYLLYHLHGPDTVADTVTILQETRSGKIHAFRLVNNDALLAFHVFETARAVVSSGFRGILRLFFLGRELRIRFGRLRLTLIMRLHESGHVLQHLLCPGRLDAFILESLLQ